MYRYSATVELVLCEPIGASKTGSFTHQRVTLQEGGHGVKRGHTVLCTLLRYPMSSNALGLKCIFLEYDPYQVRGFPPHEQRPPSQDLFWTSERGGGTLSGVTIKRPIKHSCSNGNYLLTAAALRFRT